MNRVIKTSDAPQVRLITVFSCTKLRKTLSAIALVAILGGCSDAATVASPPRDENAMSLGTQLSEDVLIEMIAQRMPAQHRDKMRELLKKSHLETFGSSDPEIIRLVGELAKTRGPVRQSDSAQLSTRAQVAMARVQNFVLVDVALSPAIAPAQSRVTIIRRPGDDGVPLVLLSETDATPEELSIGLRAAVELVARDGDVPTKESRVGIRSRRPQRPVKGTNPALLARIKTSAASKEIQGVGVVRTMRVATHSI